MSSHPELYTTHPTTLHSPAFAMATNLTEAARSMRLLKIDGYSATTAMRHDDSIKSIWIVDGYH
jgi:hypothetical protein